MIAKSPAVLTRLLGIFGLRENALLAQPESSAGAVFSFEKFCEARLFLLDRKANAEQKRVLVVKVSACCGLAIVPGTGGGRAEGNPKEGSGEAREGDLCRRARAG